MIAPDGLWLQRARVLTFRPTRDMLYYGVPYFLLPSLSISFLLSCFLLVCFFIFSFCFLLLSLSLALFFSFCFDSTTRLYMPENRRFGSLVRERKRAGQTCLEVVFHSLHTPDVTLQGVGLRVQALYTWLVSRRKRTRVRQKRERKKKGQELQVRGRWTLLTEKHSFNKQTSLGGRRPAPFQGAARTSKPENAPWVWRAFAIFGAEPRVSCWSCNANPHRGSRFAKILRSKRLFTIQRTEKNTGSVPVRVQINSFSSGSVLVRMNHVPNRFANRFDVQLPGKRKKMFRKLEWKNRMKFQRIAIFPSNSGPISRTTLNYLGCGY